MEIGAWADWASASGGALGATMGLWAVLQAKQANKTSANSNSLAEAANRLSQQANQFASDANSKSAESNGIAQQANQIAEAANRIAESARDIVLRQDQRSLETHDVRWEGDWCAPGVYAVSTSGDHSAHNVVVKVSVDDEVQEIRKERVDPNEVLRLSFPGAERQRRQEVEEIRNTRGAVPAMMYFHYIEIRATWTTALGTPKEQTDEFRLGSLGDFE
ncbi:hypothetical protein ACFV0B_41295 [Streptomyces xanthophaeus]|uniref:hypothetical protein n=1 Tax=Streptomyces xanthophaeus TaxID=67385 RepID=UPI003675B233